MNTGGDAADLMVRESIQITESSIKLAGLGAKNLAALLIALAQDNQKLQGKTTLKRLLSEGKELKVFPLKVDDISAFKDLSKEYGVLFTPIINKAEKTAYCDVLAKAEDVSKINRIFEPFYSEGSNSSRSSGTGLGLSIVKSIVENFRATIKVNSEEKKGTCFTLNFPVSPKK